MHKGKGVASAAAIIRGLQRAQSVKDHDVATYRKVNRRLGLRGRLAPGGKVSGVGRLRIRRKQPLFLRAEGALVIGPLELYICHVACQTPNSVEMCAGICIGTLGNTVHALQLAFEQVSTSSHTCVTWQQPCVRGVDERFLCP